MELLMRFLGTSECSPEDKTRASAGLLESVYEGLLAKNSSDGTCAWNGNVPSISSSMECTSNVRSVLTCSFTRA
jgi:hypothetical protein